MLELRSEQFVVTLYDVGVRAYWLRLEAHSPPLKGDGRFFRA